MRTMLEFSREELLTHAGTLKNNALDATRLYLAQHAIVDEPTNVIMTRYTNDNLPNGGGKSKRQPVQALSTELDRTSSGSNSMTFQPALPDTTSTENGDGSGGAAQQDKSQPASSDSGSSNSFHAPITSGPNEMRFEKLNHGRLVLPTPVSISHEVWGGTDLPVGMVQHGSPSRQEVQKWIKSLRQEGVPVNKQVSNIADVLAHPQIIRAMMFKCSPTSKMPTDSENIEAATKASTEWNSLWFFDVMEPMKYHQIPAFTQLSHIPCVQDLIRLRTWFQFFFLSLSIYIRTHTHHITSQVQQSQTQPSFWK
jgi:hypothetical protein